jgi:hypothetical protein
MTQLTLNPGEVVPWHYHPGTGLRVVLSGTLTEDEGCGNPMVAHPAGSAFEEVPGHVHQVFNLGSDPVVVLRTDILPSCYKDHGTIFVSGPSCEGDSGRSKLEPVAPCPSAASDANKPNRKDSWPRLNRTARAALSCEQEVRPMQHDYWLWPNLFNPRMHGLKERTFAEFEIRADPNKPNSDSLVKCL